MGRKPSFEPMDKNWLTRHITPVFGAVAFKETEDAGYLLASVEGFQIISGRKQKQQICERGLGEENALYNLYHRIACRTPSEEDTYGARLQTYNGQGEHVVMDGNDFKKSGKVYSSFFNGPVNELNPSLEP